MEILEFIFDIKFLIIIWIIIIFTIYYKTDKESKVAFKEQYYKKIPSSDLPVQVKVLMNYGRIYPRDMLATFIHLIIKGVFKFKINSNRIYIYIKNKDLIDLSKQENFLVSFIINEIGNGEFVNLDDIKNYSVHIENGHNFIKNYIKWKDLVRKESENTGFFRSKKISGFLGYGICILYTIAGVCLTIYYKKYSYLFLLIFVVITFLYTKNIIKRTEEGQKKYELWIAFKRYLKDIKQEENLCLEELISYLPYGVCLGVENNIFDYIETHIDEDFKQYIKDRFDGIDINLLGDFTKELLDIFELSIIPKIRN